MDDNLYPASSEFLMGEPLDQKLERRDEKENVFKAYPIINDLITRLKERIDYYKSVDSIDPSVRTDPEAFMHIVVANRLTCDNLRSELQALEELVRSYVAPE